MLRRMIRIFAIAALATVSACAPSIQTPVQTMPVGTEFETKFRFANSDVPLPPGKWELAAAGGTLVNNAYISLPAQTTTVSLVQIENGMLRGIVTVSSAHGASTSQPIRDRDCDRTDLLFVEVDRRYAAPDQSCLHITHLTRLWMVSGTEDAKQFNTYLVKRNVVLPALLLSSVVHHAEGGKFIRVNYEVAPKAFGGPDTPNFYGMTMIGWNPQVIGERPAYRRFADTWIEWSKAMAIQVKAGFRGTLDGFTPLPINGQPVIAAPLVENTTGEFKAPLVGTRFFTRGRPFEIAGVEGTTVSTWGGDDGGYQRAVWFAGGLVRLLMPSNFDRTAVESLWPLAVGKKAEFEQSYATSPDRWRHSIEILRTEPIVVDERRYRAFVVSHRMKAAGANMDAFERVRTLWYVPEIGWSLRQRETQLAGQPIRMFDWDVLRIVPPGG